MTIYIDQQDNELTILLVYVNDILLASTDKGRAKQMKKELASKFVLKDLGEARFCLGIEIQRHRNKAILSQTGYICDILQKFDMNNCNATGTPMLVAGKSKNLEIKIEESNEEPYRELIGTLIYLAVATRPNIAHAVNVLSQFNNYYSREHWLKAKRILRYLQGISNYGLVFKKDGNRLIKYVDADWEVMRLTESHILGRSLSLKNKAISWQSRKQ